MTHPTLLLDTTQDTLMLALSVDGTLYRMPAEAGGTPRQHSATLLPQIQALLSTHHLTPQDLHALAVNTGPGSFTGIRTGLTVARLLGQFLPELKLYPFNTVALLAAHPTLLGQTVAFYLDAFRNQHYYASLTVSRTGEITWHTAPEVLPNTALSLQESTPQLIQRSLLGKLETPPESGFTVIEALQAFTPNQMAFFLAQTPAPHPVSWEALEPLYLQLPHVTQSKKSQKKISC